MTDNFEAQCNKCGWFGYNNELAGGGQIADTGDYDDARCPVCYSTDVEDADSPIDIEAAYNNMKEFAINEYMSAHNIWHDITNKATALQQHADQLAGKVNEAMKLLNDGNTTLAFIELDMGLNNYETFKKQP